MKTLTYTFGNEHNPTDPFGRCELVVSTNDDQISTQLWHYLPNQVLGWNAVLAQDISKSIWSMLAQTDFPHTARPTSIVPDTTMCQLVVQDDNMSPKEQSVMLPLDMLKQQTGYGELLATLDSIMFQMSEGSIGGLQNALEAIVVSNVQNNYTETIY